MYKRVVRMLARAFYTRNVPEKDPNAPEPRTETQRRKAKEARFPPSLSGIPTSAIVYGSLARIDLGPVYCRRRWKAWRW